MMERYARLDTASVSDALDSLGVGGGLIGIRARVPGAKCVGTAFTVRYGAAKSENGSFKNAGNYIDDVPPGSVVVIDNDRRADCTTWGNILTEFSLKKGIAGTVVHGAVRDVAEIKALNFPLYSSSVFMQSGKNRVKKRDQQCELNISGTIVRPGDVIFADDNGCLVIPHGIALEVLERAENIEKTERKILEAVASGASLAESRNRFGYDRPWLSQ